MTTEYVDIRETMTVAQTMAHIKETGIHKETIYTCYVTDQRRLLGIVSAKDLMTTADDILIRDLMQRSSPSQRTLIKKKSHNCSLNTIFLPFLFWIRMNEWLVSSHSMMPWMLW